MSSSMIGVTVHAQFMVLETDNVKADEDEPLFGGEVLVLEPGQYRVRVSPLVDFGFGLASSKFFANFFLDILASSGFNGSINESAFGVILIILSMIFDRDGCCFLCSCKHHPGSRPECT